MSTPANTTNMDITAALSTIASKGMMISLELEALCSMKDRGQLIWIKSRK
jgi:hypothetical protein